MAGKRKKKGNEKGKGKKRGKGRKERNEKVMHYKSRACSVGLF